MNLHSILAFIKYYLKAGNAHGLHSPFVFDLYNNVIKDDMPFYIYEPIELLRDFLLADKSELKVEDFGAGGMQHAFYNSTVQKVASRSLIPSRYGRLLFRMVNHFQPKTIVELGTSLGISSLYLALPSSENTVYTMEGASEIRKKALVNFNKLNCKNIKSIPGNFDEELPALLNGLSTVDFAFIDGNHRLEPTLRYFNQLLQKKNEYSCFIFDDIHWSKEMSEAWEKIKEHPEVTLSIDIYRFGIVFFRSGVMKQDFILRY